MIKYEQCVHFRSFAESTLQAAFCSVYQHRAVSESSLTFIDHICTKIPTKYT